MNTCIRLITLLTVTTGALGLSSLAAAQTHETDRAQLASATLPTLGGDSLSAAPSSTGPQEAVARHLSAGQVRHEVLGQLQQTEADSSIARLNAIYETH